MRPPPFLFVAAVAQGRVPVVIGASNPAMVQALSAAAIEFVPMTPNEQQALEVPWLSASGDSCITGYDELSGFMVPWKGCPSVL